MFDILVVWLAHLCVCRYFEANGHGTVLFSDPALATIKSAYKGLVDGDISPTATAIRDLQSAINLINQTVGDAMSDLLLVLAIMAKVTSSQFNSPPCRTTRIALPCARVTRCHVPTSCRNALTNSARVGLYGSHAWMRPSGQPFIATSRTDSSK